eukprot:SAG11_NODE_37533_length_256_cov_0.993631_1_plen_24_part_01
MQMFGQDERFGMRLHDIVFGVLTD